MKFNKSLVTIVGAALAMSACSEFDNGFDARQEMYKKDFVDVFGQIDPSQDWSMAGRFTANVNLGSEVNGILSVYTKAPGLKGSYLLTSANVVNGKANVSFDAIKNTELLYAVIQKNGRNIVAGYYHAKNGVISLEPRVTRSAPDADATDVTLTDFVKNVWRMSETAVANVHGLNAYPLYGESDVYYTNYTYGTLSDEITSEYIENTKTSNQLIPRTIQNAHVLSGNYSEVGAEYSYEQLVKVFGNVLTTPNVPGVFKEGENHIDKYVKDGTLKIDASLQVAEDGPVSMELIWRGTQYPDAFGYFFYPTDGSALTPEYFWNTDKYILFGGNSDSQTLNNISGTSNLTQYNNYQSANSSYEGWKDLDGMAASSKMGMDGKSLMRGTKVYLVNFLSANPSYNFDKGTKIGFFLYTTQNGKPQLVFSDTKLNYELNFPIYKQDVDGETNSKTARPYAVTFDYKGQTFLGFGDGSGDCDMNDLVFGAFNVEPTDPLPDPDPTPSAATWVVACEDLGGTIDYDFNDVVFGLRKTPNFDVTKSTLELIPLAAGGTLPAHILYDDADMGEIHNMLGGSSTSTPINVVAGSSPSEGTPIVLDRSVDTDISINDLKGKLKLKINGGVAGNYFINAPNDDEDDDTPQMILFPTGWDWPSEGTPISLVYEDFVNWVNDASVTTWCKETKAGSDFVNCPLEKVYSSDGENGDASLDTYGNALPDGTLIKDDNAYPQYQIKNDILINCTSAVITFEFSAVDPHNKFMGIANAIGNYGWNDSMPSSAVWKDKDGNIVANITQPGIYHLYLDSDAISAINTKAGITIGGYTIENVVYNVASSSVKRRNVRKNR